MSTGDIGSIIHRIEYDSSRGANATVLKLSDGIVGIWYSGEDSDGWIKTYPVSADGYIGTMIDSWEFESGQVYAGYEHDFVVPVSGNVFAVAYRQSDATKLYIKTMTVATDGTITKSAIATQSFSIDALYNSSMAIIKKPGTTKYIAFWYITSPYDGHIAVINIDDDGTNISLDDSWEFAAPGMTPSIVHVSGDVFAITYGDDTNKKLQTFEIADDGTITKSFIDTATWGSGGTLDVQEIVHVSGSVYAVFSSNTDDLRTFSIASDGAITAVDTGVFFTSNADRLCPIRFVEIGGISYFVYSLRTTGYNGYAVTLPITTSGTIGSQIDYQTINSGSFLNGSKPVEVRKRIFIFPWTDTPANDGQISTADVSYPSAVYPSSSMARVSSIRHICRPGFYRMQVGLGDLGFDIDVAETAVHKALDTADEPDYTYEQQYLIEQERMRQQQRPPVPPYEPGPYWKAKRPAPSTEPVAFTPAPSPDEFPASAKITRPQPPSPTPEVTPSYTYEQQYLIEQEELVRRQRREVGYKGFIDWRKITPWVEEKGETFTSEVMERVRSFRDWIGGLFK